MLTKAGTTIFCLSVILWAMAYYPRLPEERAEAIDRATRSRLKDSWVVPQRGPDEVVVATPPPRHPTDKELDEAADNAVAAAQSEYTISGRLGHFMEPAIRPLGYDWKMGVGLVSAFAAREVFVSSMGIVYSVGEVENGKTDDLATAMRKDVYQSGPRRQAGLDAAGGHQPAGLVCAGHAVHEHRCDRPPRDRRLGLADLHAGLHERAGVCREPAGVSGRIEAFCVMDGTMSLLAQHIIVLTAVGGCAAFLLRGAFHALGGHNSRLGGCGVCSGCGTHTATTAKSPAGHTVMVPLDGLIRSTASRKR